VDTMTLTTSEATHLQWDGITPPLRGRMKTTCPKCSATRNKPLEPCLSIRRIGAKALQLFCYHCKFETRIWP